MLGWRIKDLPPEGVPQYVLIGGSHTSNWDAIILVLTGLSLGIKIGFLMKSSWFRWGLGSVFRSLGGIPIDRSKSMDMMLQVLDLFAEYEQLILAIAPEGTRRRVGFWKAGFYEIAEQAKIPIVLGYIDYTSRSCGFGPALYPSGDIEADMQVMADFYANITPKFPQQAGPIRLRPYVIRNRTLGLDSSRALDRIKQRDSGTDDEV
jgi:1-acyl-sn-glycerol-3-phosphate acyltransferase